MTHLQKNYLFFLFSIGMLLFSSCESASLKNNTSSTGPQFATNKIKDAFKEVMAIHDEVMPFISDMKRDKRQLLHLKDSSELSTQELTEIDLTIDLLNEGDSLMFDWMKSFRTPDLQMPEKEAIPYLNNEKTKIEAVNVTMKMAMKKAKAILSKTSDQ